MSHGVIAACGKVEHPYPFDLLTLLIHGLRRGLRSSAAANGRLSFHDEKGKNKQLILW
jgi:hypothetical protein